MIHCAVVDITHNESEKGKGIDEHTPQQEIYAC